HTEPWLIATSLPEGNALTNAVINAYRKRMQIEEGFRDTKSERFGLGLNLAMSRSKKRPPGRKRPRGPGLTGQTAHISREMRSFWSCGAIGRYYFRASLMGDPVDARCAVL
ncbi:MAG: hypothetical protein WDA11_05980, partial [Thiohalomonadaceae bacterium]